MSLTIRSATAADLALCYEVWRSTDGDSSDNAAYARPAPGTVLPLHRHELETGRLIVAELDAVVVGFGATLTRSSVTYLADLFVRPVHHSLGIGRALLHVLLDDAPAARFTFASSSAAARRLYREFGMSGGFELAYVRAPVESLSLDRLANYGVVAIPTSLDVACAIDLEVTGRDRRVDLVHARDTLGATLLALVRGRDTIGYGAVVHPQWWVPWLPDGTRVGPFAVRDAADAVAGAGAVVRHAIEIGATVLAATVPVPHPAHAAMLAAGFIATNQDQYMSSTPTTPTPTPTTPTPTLLDPTRYAPTIDTP